MPRFKKVFKKYERHFLLGLVIILLASFSITGALQCQGSGDRHTLQKGGEFLVAPGERAEISDTDFDRYYARLQSFRHAMPILSNEFMGLLGTNWGPDEQDAWAHLVLLSAAKEAGYTAGPHEVRSVLTSLVDQMLGELPFSEANFAQYLKNFQGTRADFEEGVRDLVLQDEFLYPLVMSARYREGYRTAFEDWRPARERVDLRYVSLPATAFQARARLQEETRRTIGQQTLAFSNLTAAAATLRRVQARLDAFKKEKGTWPAALADLGTPAQPFQVAKDPWLHVLRYAVEGEGVDLRSAGPDGAMDTADDVTPATERLLETHSGLHEVAEKLGQRHKATKAWPATLDELKSPPGGDRLPGMVASVQDGWGHDFEYEPGSGETPATLASRGPDGELGTDDDLKVTLDPEHVHVAPMGGLTAYLLPDLKDAWDRPMAVWMTRAQPPSWEVVSDGPDGQAGTDDDLRTGNQQELRMYFDSVRSDRFTLPPRRRFEVLFVQLPLVSDAVLRRLWEAYPQHRPTDEEKLYEYWRLYRGTGGIYTADDPRDPVKGHGAELAARIAPGVTATLVPAKDIFADPLVGPKQDDGTKGGDEKEDEGKKDGDGKKADEPAKDGEEAKDEGDAAESEERKAYREKGWREIVIRELFVENLLNDLLQRCRDSALARKQAARKLEAFQQAQAAYEKSLAAWEQANAGKPEAERSPKPTAPAGEAPVLPDEVTFRSLVEGELAPLIQGEGDAPAEIRFYETPEPMAREEYEKNPDFGDGIQYELSRLKQDGDYNGIPAQLHGRLTKLLLHRQEFLDAQPQALEEVEPKVFELFLGKRALDLAAESLEKLQKTAETKAEGLGDEPEAAKVDAALDEAVAEWSASVDGAQTVERTGMFIGSAPPPPVEAEDGTDDARKDEIARRNFVWRAGYSYLRPKEPTQETFSATPGTFCRQVLRDPVVEERGTGRAYLVQVSRRVYPSQAEFSPRRYTEHLGERVFGSLQSRRSPAQLKDRAGSIYKVLYRLTEDIDWIKAKFEVQTHTEFTPRKDETKRTRR